MQLRPSVIFLYLATALAAANAAPATPTFSQIDVQLADVDRFSLSRSLAQATDEPGGILVDAHPDWTKLGLTAGDVIRRIDGAPTADRLWLTEGTTLLEVD